MTSLPLGLFDRFFLKWSFDIFGDNCFFEGEFDGLALLDCILDLLPNLLALILFLLSEKAMYFDMEPEGLYPSKSGMINILLFIPLKLVS